jgi:hypothetical protein
MQNKSLSENYFICAAKIDSLLPRLVEQAFSQ